MFNIINYKVILFLVVDSVDSTATRSNHDVKILTATAVTASAVLSDSLCKWEFPETVGELNVLIAIVAS